MEAQLMNKNSMIFKIGFSAGALNLALLAWAIAGVQYGPPWEVPAALATRFVETAILSIALEGFALWSYFGAKHFRFEGGSKRRAFWTLIVIGIFLTVVSWSLDPENWRNAHPILSMTARNAEYPMIVASAILWLLVLFSRPREQP
jgi:hypothetical protein